MRRLVILRPEPGASASVARAREMGQDALAIPLFEVEPVAWEAPEAASFDALLLTSANAVRCAGDQLQAFRALPVHAVGQATADAAREAGFAIATVGTAGAERLLESIEPGHRLLHPTGEHRVDTRDGGHEIRRIIVYRSQEIERPEGLEQAKAAVVVLHSPRAAGRFAQLADQLALDRREIGIVAISEAAAEAAGTGWEMVEIADKPEDASLLALARKLCDKPRQ